METTKKCKKCGRTLPLEQFKPNHLAKDGRVSTCNQCAKRQKQQKYDRVLDVTPPHSNSKCNPELAKFTPRELMEELRARGFSAKVKHTREFEF